jgi:hypothetical protein
LLIPYRGRFFEIELDFYDHQLVQGLWPVLDDSPGMSAAFLAVRAYTHGRSQLWLNRASMERIARATAQPSRDERQDLPAAGL